MIVGYMTQVKDLGVYTEMQNMEGNTEQEVKPRIRRTNAEIEASREKGEKSRPKNPPLRLACPMLVNNPERYELVTIGNCKLPKGSASMSNVKLVLLFSAYITSFNAPPSFLFLFAFLT
jgi:hypothetical protein